MFYIGFLIFSCFRGFALAPPRFSNFPDHPRGAVPCPEPSPEFQASVFNHLEGISTETFTGNLSQPYMFKTAPNQLSSEYSHFSAVTDSAGQVRNPGIFPDSALLPNPPSHTVSALISASRTEPVSAHFSAFSLLPTLLKKPVCPQ